MAVFVLGSALIACGMVAGFWLGKSYGIKDTLLKVHLNNVIGSLCRLVECEPSALRDLIRLAKMNCGIAPGNVVEDLSWGASHVGLLKAQKERMKLCEK